MTSSVKSDSNYVKKTLLGYELSSLQDAIVNGLIPSISSCALYVFIIAVDIAVIHRHHKDEDPIWASITLFLMYLPLLGSYVVILSDWDLWPEQEGYGIENIKWVIVKTLEHLLFPVWRMWRYAERIFWSIEAIRSKDEKSRNEAMSYVNASRSIELYVFLQAYLHALPQIILQLYILMRHKSDINRQTINAQIACIVLNLAKVSITTTYYQRFKTQKLAGKQYPWLKAHKKSIIDETDNVVLRRKGILYTSTKSLEAKRKSSKLEDKYDIQPMTYDLQRRRRSSDLYLEPSPSTSRPNTDSTSIVKSIRGSVLVGKIENLFRRPSTSIADESQRSELSPSTSRPNTDSTSFAKSIRDLELAAKIENLFRRSTSIVDGPKRSVFRGDTDEPDFNIRRLREFDIKGIPEDDLAGKLVAFLWWFAFLLGRVLALSAFAYFFIKESLYVVGAHALIVLAFLLYDVKSDQNAGAKIIFFVFLVFVFIFCIIEFKIKFKKGKFIYYGFFTLVYIENLVMCLVWYNNKIETLENDFWFRYIFVIIAMCWLCSLLAMIFYFNVNQPKKVVVDTYRAVSS